jgi:membrane-associated phospholipid phosphatase
MGGDFLHVLSSPFHITQKEGLNLISFTAFTAICVGLLDKPLDKDFIESEDTYLMPAFGLAKFGQSYHYFLIGIPVVTLSGGLIYNDKKLLETTRLMFESYFISGAITQIAKNVFGRARPFTNEGPIQFNWLNFRHDRHSFPSGHTAGAFSVMTVLAKQCNQWHIKIPAYTLALAVAMHRIDSRNHWGADVIVGGAIGYWVGSTLVNRYKKKTQGVSVNPYAFVDRIGLVISF